MKINLTLLTCSLISMTAAADPVTINNNNYSGGSAPQQSNQNNAPSCNNQASNANTERPGTYYSTNPHGGTDTIYTTGDKTPYMVDNNCNQQPPIQPYVYVNPQNGPPGPPGPPGPRSRGR